MSQFAIEYTKCFVFFPIPLFPCRSRERAKSNDVMPPALNITNNNTSTGIDEYQYFAPNDPNNPQNQSTTPPITAAIAPALCSQSTQIIPKASITNTTNSNAAAALLPAVNLPMTTLAGSQLQPDVLLNLTPNTLAALQKLNTVGQNFAPVQPLRPLSRARSLTIRSCSSSPSIYIKDEPDSLDETISLDTNSNGKIKIADKSLANRTKATSAKALLNTKPLNSSTQNLVIDERDCSDLDDDPDDDVDMLDDRLSIDTSLQSLQKDNAATNAANNGHPHSSKRKIEHFYPKPPTAREILYTKFGEFLAARLNTLNETVANELMNKILMLIAEK